MRADHCRSVEVSECGDGRGGVRMGIVPWINGKKMGVRGETNGMGGRSRMTADNGVGRDDPLGAGGAGAICRKPE